MTACKIGRGIVAAAAIVACVQGAHAAVLAPARGYVKPGEPVNVRFLKENAAGKEAFAKIGLAAVDLDIAGMFAPAPAGDVVAADGGLAFALYGFDGKRLDPGTKEKPDVKGDGSVDLGTVFPQVRAAGTYVLVWKDATPLVIEVLRNPTPWAMIMDDTVAADKRAAAIKYFSQGEPVVTHLVPLEYAVIKTDHGDIQAKFYYDVAPHTIDNFITLARQKFYDGSAFHRIMSGFMIQGGDSLANTERAGTGGPGYSVEAEFSDKPHVRGVLSMARAGIDGAGSQFFIVHQTSPHLNGKYTAFGEVMGEAGLKVVDDIATTPADKESGKVTGIKPKIESVRIVPATAEMYGVGK